MWCRVETSRGMCKHTAQCERDVNNPNRKFWFPSSVVSADEIDVAVQEDNIARHQPSFKTFHSGVLYATGGRTPVLVHVPLKHHISAFRNPSDL
ncbi:hypothetical protein K503DRAFT_54587 [Rhizopogon vinicolor AM-OR11-026]|uniref:Uncharacterized protein n=1 Tax=Rhizopogon vinicolor AM-OR11-026 TaxID=1314800 RepID=A0A1B7MGL2_9AGAM|nr:hypothetical protein K503DRAFT_54587 [Rhizopogon vinicolor AM-OR11-026]